MSYLWDSISIGIIVPDEMSTVGPGDVTSYLREYMKENPVKQSRMSKQVWLFPDKSTDEMFKSLQVRSVVTHSV